MADLNSLVVSAHVVEANSFSGAARILKMPTSTVTGKISAEGNQELFIFKRDSDGKFKIARYSFSTTNPQD